MNRDRERIDLGGTCFVAHVKTRYEQRERHIQTMLQRLSIPFEWMLRGDIADITDTLEKQFFSGPNDMTPAAKSCTLKHLLICREIVSRNLTGALVLEDDIVLSDRFVSIFNKSMAEKVEYEGVGGEHPVIINYEDTRARFVERSRRRKGRVLYPGDRDRMAGCYYINAAAAQLITESYGKADSPTLPIDLYHSHLLNSGKLTYLWCQPTVATQGSFNGKFSSSLSFDKAALSGLRFRIKRDFRRLLYFFR